MTDPMPKGSASPFSSPVADGGDGRRSASDGVPPASKQNKVTPSTQDPVHRWLDIFVPMTGLPRSRQHDIRAELEDHLRARVDDLVITGLSEPEAIQKAVNELGETAHLARQFRTALKPKRNLLMQTAIIATAGAAITFGVVALTSHAPAAFHPAHTAEQVTDPGGHGAHPITGLRDQTYGGLFDQLVQVSDIPVLVHWDRLELIGVTPETPLDLDVETLPSHLLYRLLQERTAETASDPIAVEDSHELIEFSTRSHFDRRSTVIRPHDISRIVELCTEAPSRPGGIAAAGFASQQSSERAGLNTLDTLIDLVEPDSWAERGGDLISARFVGASIIVSAPERLHAEIERVIGMMTAETERFRHEQQAAVERAAVEHAEAAEKDRVMRVESIGALRTELADQLDRIVALEARKTEIAAEIEHLERSTNPLIHVSGETADERAERIRIASEKARTAVPALRAESVRVQIEIDDTMAYRAHARERLIDLQETSEP